MFAITIKYKNYSGASKSREIQFNMTPDELSELESSYARGIQGEHKRLADAEDKAGMVRFLSDIFLRSYGEQSSDGEYFIKSEDSRDKFAASAVYAEFFLQVVRDEHGVLLDEFFNNVLPQGYIELIDDGTDIDP